MFPKSTLKSFRRLKCFSRWKTVTAWCGDHQCLRIVFTPVTREENAVCLRCIAVQGLYPAHCTLVCIGECSTPAWEAGSLKSKCTTASCFASECNFSITEFKQKALLRKTVLINNCTLLVSHEKQFLSGKSALNEAHNRDSLGGSEWRYQSCVQVCKYMCRPSH